MKHDEMLFRHAVEEMQGQNLNAAEISGSARRVAERLAAEGWSLQDADASPVSTIESCNDVQRLFAPYRAGTLSQERSLVMEAHLRDCSICHNRFRRGSNAPLNWSTPQAVRATPWHPRAFAWSAACAFALCIAGTFIYKAYWQIPPGVRASVQSIDGPAYRIAASSDIPLMPGDALSDGDQIRTGAGTRAVLRLADGSTVEVNERSTLGVAARGHNTTVTLNGGDVIVQAAKRTSGHLYVKTPDCRVAVTGTVFSVDSGIKGSRVGVLQGSVDVSHAGIDTVIHAGGEVTTNGNLTPEPVEQQISWSHHRDQYLPLLAQLATLQHRIEAIPFPGPRYTSDLLQRVPADTQLYISVPNLGSFLSQANQIFHDQMQQSPALQQWWNQGRDHNTADLDALVEKMRQASEYLGDEVVIVGAKQSDSPGFAILADAKKAGLDEFLKNQLPVSDAHPGLTVLDASALASFRSTSPNKNSAFALVGPHEAIFSNSIDTLKRIDTQLNAGASGFAESDFGKQIAAAYTRGAGIILAADLHQMVTNKISIVHGGNGAHRAIAGSGLEDVRYLIAEHREIDGKPENHLSLQFSGARQGIASWLAPPAPIGSLDFVTPNASIAVAGLSKDPKAMVDDLLAMAVPGSGERSQDLQDAEAKLHVNFRDDLAATLGGDFLVALDGPVLPTPSWKAVIEVHDSARLEGSLEHLAEAIRGQVNGKNAHSIAIESTEVDGQRFYAVHDQTSGTTPAQYTFAHGYMIVAPTRALLIEALETYASGNSLARSAAFRALLPKDANENYSAVAYQNLTPVLSPLLEQFTGQAADTIRQLASDARPTAICARGEEKSIEASSDSRLFGFDFLTLETLMNLGNKHAAFSVKD